MDESGREEGKIWLRNTACDCCEISLIWKRTDYVKIRIFEVNEARHYHEN